MSEMWKKWEEYREAAEMCISAHEMTIHFQEQTIEALRKEVTQLSVMYLESINPSVN